MVLQVKAITNIKETMYIDLRITSFQQLDST